MNQANNRNDMYPLPEIDTNLKFASATKSPCFEECMLYVNAGRSVDAKLAKNALLEVLNSKNSARDSMLGALLMGLTKDPSAEVVAELIHAVEIFEGVTLTSSKIYIGTRSSGMIVGCAGSGKKGRKTINISTPAMVVASAAGAQVVKAGSRSASSITGSTDILEALGFRVPTTLERSSDIFSETGFGFYSIEDTIPKFDAVYGNRFFAPHILSYVLPAMLIPVQVDTIFYGYAGPNISLSAQSFKSLGCRSVFVCNNTLDGLRFIDEMATEGTTSITGIIDGQLGDTVSFEAQHYMKIDYQTIPGIQSKHNVHEQRKFIIQLLEGELKDSIAENTICLNAATILYLGKIVENPFDGFMLAKQTIHNGLAQKKLMEIIHVSSRSS